MPHLCWYIARTLDGDDPPTFQQHQRMETIWWHFSETWKNEVVQEQRQGRRKRTLSFSRSRHLMDYAKVV
eukprot:684969-Alexandrium_andersonii.AAC.1